MSIELFFFPFLFSGYVGLRVVCIVSYGCNPSLSALFFKSSSHFIDMSTLSSILVRPLPPVFLISIVRQHYLWDENALCIVISFLVLVHLSSSRVYFNNDPKYPTRVTAQLSIPLIRFLQYDFVSICFLVLLRYHFLILLSPLVWWCQLPIFPSICWFPFLRAF